MADGKKKSEEGELVDWVIPIAQGVDLSKEKKYALNQLYIKNGWVVQTRPDGKSDVVEEVIGGNLKGSKKK